MSLGPRTQNEITTAITKIPGILKWLGQLDEKVKNLDDMATKSLPKNNDVKEAITELTKNFNTEIEILRENITKLVSINQLANMVKLLEKQKASLTKQQTDFEKEIKRTISNLEKKIIDLSTQNINTSETVKNTRNTKNTRKTKESVESNNKGE